MRSTCIAGFLALLLLATPALADDGIYAGEIRDAKGLIFPLERTEVDADIAGAIARVTVTQTFTNPNRHPVEAIYKFPLPDRAGVDGMRIQIGSRVIRAELASRAQAIAAYKQAKENGQTAALTTQVRPNLFTQKIANLLPGESIVVELTYVEDLAFDGGHYSFVFPMVAAPRYAGGAADAHRLPGSFLAPGDRPGHTIGVNVRIDAGVAIGDVESESHAIDVVRDADHLARVSLHPADGIPNQDFVLSWTVARDQPQVGVLAHRVSADGYFSLVIQPELEIEPGLVTPREMVFVLDCSGSMSGMPIETAKTVVSRTLQTLSPSDTFQILRFSDQASGLADHPLRATPANIRMGLAYVDQLQGMGGTQILSGIRKALEGFPDRYRLRIVHFLTDGLVGNEGQILAEMEKLLGTARVFPLGVGTSVNRFLLERMAEVGRGAVSYIRHDADQARIDAEVEKFVGRVRQPSLVDLQIDWGGLPVRDVVPADLPDLFVGKPIVVTGRYDGPGAATVTIRGTRGRSAFRREIEVVLPRWERANSALEKLWARARIKELMLDTYGGGLTGADAEILRLALEHELLTQYTAFVAVDEQVVVRGGETRKVVQPAAFPEGMGGSEFFGIITGNPPAAVNVPPVTAKKNRYRKTPELPRDSRATFPPPDEDLIIPLYVLKRWQDREGCWPSSGGLLGDVGSTALALLALRAGGATDKDGLFAEEVSKGLRYLNLSRESSGRIGSGEGPAWLIDHTLATIAAFDYCEASAWKRGWRLARTGLKYLVKQQNEGLGWSRNGANDGGDTLTTALAILAIRRGESAGMSFDRSVLDGARNFLESVTDRKTGRVRMGVTADPTAIDPVAIGAAIVARTALGARPKDSVYLRKGAALVFRVEPPVGGHEDLLHLFFATAGLARVGGETWDYYSAPLDSNARKTMIPTVETDEEGHPVLVGPAHRRLGRSAAMALFALARSYYDRAAHPFTGR